MGCWAPALPQRGASLPPPTTTAGSFHPFPLTKATTAPGQHREGLELILLPQSRQAACARVLKVVGWMGAGVGSAQPPRLTVTQPVAAQPPEGLSLAVPMPLQLQESPDPPAVCRHRAGAVPCSLAALAAGKGQSCSRAGKYGGLGEGSWLRLPGTCLFSQQPVILPGLCLFAAT